MKKLKGRRIVLAVTGGIAAYKACALASKLVHSGAAVRAVMTHTATRLVGPLTLQALTNHPVVAGDEGGVAAHGMEHIELAQWGEILVVVPCTAHMLGMLAHGLGGDVVSTLSLAFRGPQVLCPAMNPHMWQKPAVRRNVKTLRGDGFIVVEPETGPTACGEEGEGRLPAEERLIEIIAQHLP